MRPTFFRERLLSLLRLRSLSLLLGFGGDLLSFLPRFSFGSSLFLSLEELDASGGGFPGAFDVMGNSGGALHAAVANCLCS